MKFATHGTRIILAFYTAIALLAGPMSCQVWSAGDSVQLAGLRCDGCVSRAIDLGPQGRWRGRRGLCL
jgi:hypothetical protein